MEKVLGGILLALPFVATFVYGVKTIGAKGTLLVFAAVAVVVGIIFAGVYLLTGSLT